MAERLVVVGGDAAGMSAAVQARHRDPDLEIVALERGQRTSYSACGIPYHLAGDVESLDDLVVREPQEFRDEYRIDVRLGQEVTALDVAEGQVQVRDLAHGREFSLAYDHLLLATGGVPFRPDLPGIDLEFVKGVQTLDDASDLLEFAEKTQVDRVVVVGGGYIGLEMAEAFTRWGAEVLILERGRHLLSGIDPDMADPLAEAMGRYEIEVRCNAHVIGFEPGEVLTESGSHRADLVLLGTGVRPNAGLARDAGLDAGPRGGVLVDRRQQTSVAGVWAAGDCCESRHLVTGQPVHVALGTVANRQGRVAGINIAGGYATFPGELRTAVTRICGLEVGRTGLTEGEAEAAGFGVVSERIRSRTQAGYLTETTGRVAVKLVVERGTGLVLGGQIVGEEGSAKRIDVIATAITAGMTADDMINLDLGYAPPFSPVWDPVVTAARAAARAVSERG